ARLVGAGPDTAQAPIYMEAGEQDEDEGDEDGNRCHALNELPKKGRGRRVPSCRISSIKPLLLLWLWPAQAPGDPTPCRNRRSHGRTRWQSARRAPIGRNGRE